MSKEERKVTRYLGYVVSKDGNVIDGMRYGQPMRDDQFEEFIRVVGITAELRTFVIDFIALEENFRAFDRIPSDFRTHLEALNNMMTEGALSEAMRLMKAQNALSNFLYATSAFRDRCLTRLRESYGEQSSHYTSFEIAIKAAYDEALEYRVLYNLRNFAQHHDIPLSLVPVEANLNVETKKVEASVSIVLAPSHLAKSSLVQKSFRPELSRLTEDINLCAYARVYFRLHARLLKTILDNQASRIDEMSAYREAVTRVLKLPSGAHPVVWEGDVLEHRGTVGNARFIHFSFDELNLILVLYEHAERVCVGDK